MKNFRRVLRLTFRYRWTIFSTLVCALILAVSWGGNITAILPLVEITFKNREGAEEYWDRYLREKTESLADHKENLLKIQDEISFKRGEEKPGKDADFAVYEGDPMVSDSVCRMVFINGERIG